MRTSTVVDHKRRTSVDTSVDTANTKRRTSVDATPSRSTIDDKQRTSVDATPLTSDNRRTSVVTTPNRNSDPDSHLNTDRIAIGIDRIAIDIKESRTRNQFKWATKCPTLFQTSQSSKESVTEGEGQRTRRLRHSTSIIRSMWPLKHPLKPPQPSQPPRSLKNTSRIAVTQSNTVITANPPLN